MICHPVDFLPKGMMVPDGMHCIVKMKRNSPGSYQILFLPDRDAWVALRKGEWKYERFLRVDVYFQTFGIWINHSGLGMSDQGLPRQLVLQQEECPDYDCYNCGAILTHFIEGMQICSFCWDLGQMDQEEIQQMVEADFMLTHCYMCEKHLATQTQRDKSVCDNPKCQPDPDRIERGVRNLMRDHIIVFLEERGPSTPGCICNDARGDFEYVFIESVLQDMITNGQIVPDGVNWEHGSRYVGQTKYRLAIH